MPIIHVCGAPGAGKTTLATALARDLALPLVAVDEERRKLLRPGESWPRDDSQTWRALTRAVDEQPVVVLETMGGTRNADALLAGREVFNVVVSAPDRVRMDRLRSKSHRRDDPLIGSPDKYLAAVSRIPVPVIRADAQWDGLAAIPSDAYQSLLSTLRDITPPATSKRSPLAMTTDMTVKFAAGSDTIVEGLGVPFGVDLDGESFSAKTDLCPSWFPNGGRPILYHHGFDSSVKFEAIGHEIESTMTDDGLWVRAELDKASKYYAKVKKLVAQGAVGWSSGAPDHKVKMGQGGVYDRWPPVEFSLTPTPAFPNRVAYSMKSADAIKHLEAVDADIPEPLSAAAIEQAHEGDSEPEPLADHSERVLAGVKAWVERVSEKSDFRAKSGRELSKRNIDALRETHRIIGELLARADAPSKDEERATAAKTAYADFLRIEAERLTA